MHDEPISHDQNFKNLILDYPREALEFFAASEARAIPPEAQITPVREELLKERLGDRFFELDVPLLVEWPGGEREAIVFCIEENTKGNVADLRRHAVYVLQLSEMLDMTRVVPVAIHPFDKKPAAETFELKGDFGTYLHFKAITTTLSIMEAERHLESENRVELICLPLMKHAQEQKRKVVWASINGLNKKEKNKDKRSKYLRFVFQYSKLDAQELRNMSQEAAQHCANPEEFMSTMDVLLAQGEVKGMAKGTIKTILNLCKSGIISNLQAREQLEKLSTAGEISQDDLRESLAKLS